MNNKKCIKLGFTLAEVLITLVIIGVIAALTVPTLMKNTQKQEFVTGLKKANSTLSQALVSMARNNDAAVGDYSFLNDVDFIDEFAKVVSVSRKCTNVPDCFGASLDSSGPYKRLNNTVSQGSNAGKAVIMSDGQVFSFRTRATTGTYFGLSTEDANNGLGRIIIDINGNKNPNVFGRDTFIFYVINGKGIVPAGADNTNDCLTSSAGHTCASKVLRENAMNY